MIQKMKKRNKSAISLILLFFLVRVVSSQNLVTFLPPDKPAKPVLRDTIVLADASPGLQCYKVFENKMLVEEWCIQNGKKQGAWAIYQSNGTLLVMSHYADGKRDGLYIACEKNGAILVQQYYKNDQLHGEQRKYTNTAKGRILKSHYMFKEGKLNGTCTDFSDNGTIQTQTEYVMGVKSGIAKWYFSSGILAMEQTYRDNALNGIQKVYNPQGILVSEGNLINNKKNGEWKEYFDSGKLKSQGSYRDDKQCGEWKFFDASGSLSSTQQFEC
jgi:antitoxin component YwqK of YwqJK toxin-antitoxin module